MRGDGLYASYYTNPLDRDYTWILGMFRPSNIRMARIDLRALEAGTYQFICSVHPATMVGALIVE